MGKRGGKEEGGGSEGGDSLKRGGNLGGEGGGCESEEGSGGHHRMDEGVHLYPHLSNPPFVVHDLPCLGRNLLANLFLDLVPFPSLSLFPNVLYLCHPQNDRGFEGREGGKREEGEEGNDLVDLGIVVKIYRLFSHLFYLSLGLCLGLFQGRDWRV